MLIAKATFMAAIAIATLALNGDASNAQDVGIYGATLAEAGQKTQEVTTGQLRRILADGSAIVLDTRSRAEFDAGHIPGARNLDAVPGAQVAAVESLANGNKGAALVLYCNGPFCQASRRVADALVAAGFTDVRRYQLGIPMWRALGGPTAVEIGGITRIFNIDRTAVFIDARTSDEFTKGSLPGAHSIPIEDLIAGRLKNLPLPEDDFNRRIILFGRDGAQARSVAESLGKRPWHNVAYFPGSFETLATALKGK